MDATQLSLELVIVLFLEVFRTNNPFHVSAMLLSGGSQFADLSVVSLLVCNRSHAGLPITGLQLGLKRRHLSLKTANSTVRADDSHEFVGYPCRSILIAEEANMIEDVEVWR